MNGAQPISEFGAAGAVDQGGRCVQPHDSGRLNQQYFAASVDRRCVEVGNRTSPQCFSRPRSIGRSTLDVRADCFRLAGGDRAKQLLLVGELVVERASGYPCRRPDLRRACRCEAIDAGLRLGEAISAVDPSFDATQYAGAVAKAVAGKELKARVFAMAELLRQHMPDDFARAAEVLEGALGPELDGETGIFTYGYWLMPVARFVEEFGTDDWEASMRLCEAVTRRHTGEYAVRPFLAPEVERTLIRMAEWSASPSPHVRRLASEGARPRLPWAKRLDNFLGTRSRS